MCTLTHRGRQSIGKRLSPAHLNVYRSSVMNRRGERVTIDDVKQVAVSLLHENYSLPIPFCFLSMLKSKELDDVLAALLVYLSFFFDYKSLENKLKHFMAVGIITVHQKLAEALARQEIAKKKLAICYFSLFMDLEMKQNEHTSQHKGQMLSHSAEWLLHACLYSFFCCVAWVTFDRKNLRDIQEEVGRLLYSDTFNTAVRNGTNGSPAMTSTILNGSLNTEEADPKETGCKSTFKKRMFQRHPTFNSVVNQRSPLMVSLLPSPKERSPHLFHGSQDRRLSPWQAVHCDNKVLMEQINQQLASVSIGILGKPLKQFSCSTLIAHGEQKNNRDGDGAHEPGTEINNNEDHPGRWPSFMGPKSTHLADPDLAAPLR
uniref:Protein phosphatase 1 regulatory subunit 36 n=1 Tax=Monopterus albus TaxID=43700 RepID=A0A3Q3JAS2_MONAL|nr:protein phosphatase 1 regulatory subunit 36 [Monopterus albus]